MSEVAFPLLGAALVISVVLPMTAVLVRLILILLGRGTSIGGLRGLTPRYFLLVGVVAVPIAWFSSAAAHQAETGRSVLACILDHGADPSCLEPRLFSLVLLGAIGAFGIPTIVRGVTDGTPLRRIRRQAAHPRVAALIDSVEHLGVLRRRVHVSADLPDPIATRGSLRPAVFVRTSWLDGVDDAALAAALAHEAEHVRGRDPLRYLLLSLSRAVNPLGAMVLGAELRRWVAAREVQCDRLAVARGADPTALAHALVLAARPAEAIPVVAALEPTDLGALQLRVSLLLAYAEQPERVRAELGAPRLSLALVLLGIVAALPHTGQTAALDALHVGTERAVESFLP